ncbi:kow motif domain-containing protein, partial [Cystoisospora suis]
MFLIQYGLGGMQGTTSCALWMLFLQGPESTEREEEEEEEEEEVLSGSSSDEGDEDEDEEEDEEEEEQPRKKSSKHDKSRKSSSSSKRKSQSDRRSRSKDGGKRKKRRGVTAFLDVEAQEGDDEEEEDADDFLDYSDEAAQAARLAAQAAEARRAGGRDDRGGASQQRRGGAGHLENAIDSLARRYQDQTFEEGEEEEDDLLEDADGYPYEDGNEGNLLPDITDPKLWMVKLNKMGVEREVCISILNKCFQQQERGRDPEIYSCYASDDLKGYVYVEAHSQYAIKEALQGLRLVRTYGDIKIVPLQEMPAVFNSVRSQAPYIPQRNDFVRIKRGMYANDIAQIHQVEEQGMIVTVRLIPRLDLNALLDREKHGGDFGRKGEMTLLKRMGGVRPQKRFFDRDEIDARGGQVEQGVQPGTVRFAGMTFEESGYLLRRIAVRHLLVGSTASPSLAEVTEFVQGQQDKEGDDLQENRVPCSGVRVVVSSVNAYNHVNVFFFSSVRRPLSSFLKRQRSAYRLGERVRVIKGELQGMRGKIGERRQDPEEDDEEESVEVVLEHKKLGAVMLKTSHLVKDLQVGENVRAVGGVNAGHSGLITSIDFNRQTATVFSPAAGLEVGDSNSV